MDPGGVVARSPDRTASRGVEGYFRALPFPVGLLCVVAVVLALLEVTNDVLSGAARTAPTVLGLALGIPVFLLLLAPALGQGEAGETGIDVPRLLSGLLVAGSVAALVLIGTWRSNPATSPVVSLAPGSAAPVTDRFTATVRVHGLRSDEVADIVITRATELGADRCSQDDPLVRAEQGADRTGEVDYAVTAAALPSSTLVCLTASTPRRCDWEWLPGRWCPLEHDARTSTIDLRLR